MENVNRLRGVFLGDEQGAAAFQEMFRKVNRYYRRGHFEIRIDPATGDEVRPADANWAEGLTLQDAARALSEIAMEYWERKQVPSQYYQPVLRSIVIAYEIQDYFLDVPDRLKLFLDNFSAVLATAADLKETVLEIALMHIQDFDERQAEDEYTRLANEFLLLVMSSINSLYRQHSPEAYDLGLQQLQQVERLIKQLDTRKRRESLGLLGLQRYLLGRMSFGVGNFSDADRAFRDSAHSYSERIKARIKSKSADPEQSADDLEETRLLSLRRATLARCLGSAYLYVVQGRLREAIDLLDTWVPLLALDCGRIIAEYCELIRISASRALNSHDDQILAECEDRIRSCLEVFNKYVENSHYPRRAILELVLIKHFRSSLLFQASRYSSRSEKERVKDSLTKSYMEGLHQLEDVKAFARAGGKPESENPRLLIEALTLSAQIRRNHLSMARELGSISSIDAMSAIEECIKEAREAIRLSESMKQQHCEALMALGQALQYQQTINRESRETHSENSNTAWREKARAEYLKTLSANRNENPRITASVFLLLVELEMEDQGNYFKAKKYFEKYKKIAGLVEHRFCLDMATSLEIKFERPDSDFSIDIDSEVSLDLKYWQGKLQAFLIQQAMNRIAQQYLNQLPAKDKKGDARPNDDNERANFILADKLRRETKLSILANGFIKELGLRRKSAYDLAGKRLQDFKNLASQPDF